MRLVECALASAVGIAVVSGCGSGSLARRTQSPGAAPGFLTSGTVVRTFQRHGVQMYRLPREPRVLYGSIPFLGLHGIWAISIIVYPDELTARSAAGDANMDGRPVPPLRVANVLLWIDPKLPQRGQRRFAAAVRTLRFEAASCRESVLSYKTSSPAKAC
jgi:hypothetical protein